MIQIFKVRMLRDLDEITHDPIRAANFWPQTPVCLTTATDWNGCCFGAQLWCVSDDITG